MVIGATSLLTLVTEHLLEDPLASFVALGLAVGAVWFLRPKQSRQPHARATHDEFLTVKGKWFVGISLALGIASTIAIV